MNLAACYTVFNGTELLERSIDQIESMVNHIIICYQEVSNKGNHYSQDTKAVIRNVARMDKVTVVKYVPDLSADTKENERRKHQLMLQTSRDLGCTHFLLAACDHFYNSYEFLQAKKMIEPYNWDVTFTAMFTYYKNPEWQLTPIEDYFMPFIMRLRPDTKISNSQDFPLRVDPSVRVNTWKNWHLFPQDKIMLHHFSMIRIDIRDKFKNAAASIRWKPEQVEAFTHEFETYDIETNPGVQYFKGRKIQLVQNYFDL